MKLYQLIGGLSIYGEPRFVDGQERPDQLVFDATKACFITVGPKGSSILRCDKGGGKPTQVCVPLSAVLLYHDVTDPQALAAFGSEISGLVLPGLKIVN